MDRLTIGSLVTLSGVAGAYAAWPFSSDAADVAGNGITNLSAAAVFFTGLALGAGVMYFARPVSTRTVTVQVPAPKESPRKEGEGAHKVSETVQTVASAIGGALLGSRPAGSYAEQIGAAQAQIESLQAQVALLAEQENNLPKILDVAKKGDVDNLELLIKNRAPLGTTESGRTALHIAAGLGHTKFVERLLKHLKSQPESSKPIIDIDAKDARKNTALHDAVATNRVDAAIALVKAGAKFDILGEGGKTAQQLASEKNVKVDFEKHAPKVKPPVVEKKEEKPAAPKRDPKEVLGFAQVGKVDDLKAFLKAEGDPSQAKDEKGNNALQVAAKFGHNKFIDELLKWHKAQLKDGKNGFDIDAKGEYGMTALHLAMESKKEPSIYALLDAGAKYDIQNGALRTAQDIATEKGLEIKYPKSKEPKEQKKGGVSFDIGGVNISLGKPKPKAADGSDATTDVKAEGSSSSEEKKKEKKEKK